MEEYDNDKDGGAVSSKMVGVSDLYAEVKANLMRSPVTSVVGMPGIGKTTLVRKLFQDPEVVERFDHRVWVRVGENCHVNDVPRRIQAKMDPEGDGAAAYDYLKANLKSERYLIVLDDVWDHYIAYLLHPYHRYKNDDKIHHFLDHSESGSRILLTSRLQQRGKYKDQLGTDVITMRLLNKEESWDLLREKVFPQGTCPPQLKKAGEKISENCEGLPLTIIAVAGLLSKADKTQQYWNEVAENKNHPLFKEAYDEISKVLLSSYTHLPPLLRMCFVFLGVFPQNYEIPRSKVINLWLADGFRELNVETYSHHDCNSILDELVSNSVVVVYQKSTINYSHTIKTCGLHSSLWHLSNKKARETKFCLVIHNPYDGLGDGIKGYRRLSFHNNVLLGNKDVCKSVEDNCAPTALSLLCYGPYHQYQVPILFGLKLLRELDALLIRFYEFPVEVVQLVQLRYLCLTLNGMFPASISQLSNLEFLIADRHQSIKSHKHSSYLPVEIWGMKTLKLIQVTGNDLPDPCGASLERLSTLSNVSALSCTKAVFNAIPNLRELRIQIELAPDDDGKLLNCFGHVSHLGKLQSLKCVIVNPVVVPPVLQFPTSPSLYHLLNLSLSGLCYPWKEIGKIASIFPFLNVLKLKNYAFQGLEWEVKEKGLKNLTSLVIEDTDVVDWKVGCGAFDNLRSLSMKHCYKLKKIHGEFGMFLRKIELVDCNPLCVEEIKNATTKGSKQRQLHVHCTWDDRKRKT